MVKTHVDKRTLNCRLGNRKPTIKQRKLIKGINEGQHRFWSQALFLSILFTQILFPQIILQGMHLEKLMKWSYQKMPIRCSKGI